MDAIERPLHVRVAEALGWIELRENPPSFPGDPTWWQGRAPDGNTSGITAYDTDWSATGPLIERYSINVSRTWKAVDWDVPGDHWIACIKDAKNLWTDGPTPLVAVCNLLLALHAAGKLEAPQEQVTS